MSDNPYEAPADGSVAPSPSNESVAADVPQSDDPFGVAKMVLEDLKANPGGYFMSGIGYLLFMTGAVFVVLGAVFLSILPGMMTESEGLMMAGGAVGMLIYMVGILVLSFVVAPLQMASLIRALDTQMKGEGAVGFGSMFNTMRQDAGRIILVYLLYQTTVLVGMLFLYLPGLAAAALGMYVMPIVCLEPEVGIVDAYTRGWNHFKDNLGWHAGVWLSLLVAIVFLEITLVGLLVLMPVMCAWQVAAYRSSMASTAT